MFSTLNVYGYTALFFCHVFEGRRFCASILITWRTKFSQNAVYSSREIYAPMGANSIHYEMTSNYIGDNNENDRVASPESVPIHLN